MLTLSLGVVEWEHSTLLMNFICTWPLLDDFLDKGMSRYSEKAVCNFAVNRPLLELIGAWGSILRYVSFRQMNHHKSSSFYED